MGLFGGKSRATKRDLLYKGGVEMPSDLHGLVTIHIGDQVRDET